MFFFFCHLPFPFLFFSSCFLCFSFFSSSFDKKKFNNFIPYHTSRKSIIPPIDLPNGPFTLIVLFSAGLYEVLIRTVFKSLIESSTPGGIVMGVRPSFEGRFVVVQNCRGVVCLCLCLCHAGTRNPGRAAPQHDEVDERRTWPISPPRLGTNLEAIAFAFFCQRNG